MSTAFAPIQRTRTSGYQRPSQYQMTNLRANGERRRPATFDRAKALLDKGPPTPAQRDLLRSLSLPVPASKGEASAALTAYETAHPEWAASRKQAQRAKATETRRLKAGPAREFDAQVSAFYDAALARFPEGSTPTAATPATIAKLRTLALRLPSGDPLRMETFRELNLGMHGRDAGSRLGRITSRLNRESRTVAATQG